MRIDITTLSNLFQVSEKTAKLAYLLIKGKIPPDPIYSVEVWRKQCHHWPPSAPEMVMCALDHILETCGVEAIYGNYVDQYHQDIQAAYLNTGDTYACTILFDNVSQRYRLVSWGDFVEINGRKRGIK